MVMEVWSIHRGSPIDLQICLRLLVHIPVDFCDSVRCVVKLSSFTIWMGGCMGKAGCHSSSPCFLWQHGNHAEAGVSIVAG